MIDNFMYDEKFRLKRSYILKVINFLICMDFSQSFMNFFVFILNLFTVQIIIIIVFVCCADMANDLVVCLRGSI